MKIKHLLIVLIYLITCIIAAIIGNNPNLNLGNKFIGMLISLVDFFTDNYQEIESLVTILAIALAGIWTYKLFIKNRQKYPRADLSHQISHIHLDDNQILLSINIKIMNIGDVLISIESGEVRIQKILPINDEINKKLNAGIDPVPENEHEIPWPIIHERECRTKKGEIEIEPGESDHIKFDFIIENKVRVIEVYTYFKNVKKGSKDLGWCLTSLYDLREKKRRGQ